MIGARRPPDTIITGSTGSVSFTMTMDLPPSETDECPVGGGGHLGLEPPPGSSGSVSGRPSGFVAGGGGGGGGDVIVVIIVGGS